MSGATSLARTADRGFDAMVEKEPGCWLWTGSVIRLGYGQVGVMLAPGRRRMIPAHRLAWERARGAIPDRVDVLHLCGNGNFVRPEHLTLRDPVETSRLPTFR
jgi:HNH endonuclease